MACSASIAVMATPTRGTAGARRCFPRVALGQQGDWADTPLRGKVRCGALDESVLKPHRSATNVVSQHPPSFLHGVVSPGLRQGVRQKPSAFSTVLGLPSAMYQATAPHVRSGRLRCANRAICGAGALPSSACASWLPRIWSKPARLCDALRLHARGSKVPRGRSCLPAASAISCRPGCSGRDSWSRVPASPSWTALSLEGPPEAR